MTPISGPVGVVACTLTLGGYGLHAQVRLEPSTFFIASIPTCPTSGIHSRSVFIPVLEMGHTSSSLQSPSMVTSPSIPPKGSNAPLPHDDGFGTSPTSDISASSHLASAAHPVSDHDQQERFLTKQLATINYVPALATEELIDLLRALEKVAPQAVRNKHKIYSILRVARDTCSYIVEIGNPPNRTDAEVRHLLDRMERYCVMLGNLEECVWP